MTGLTTGRWGPQPTAWMCEGLPTWRPGGAPDGLLTWRQMREAGLSPGGAQPVAQIAWPGRQGRRARRAMLWDRDELVAKRVPTRAQLAAVAAALAARRRCTGCGRDAGYCVQRAIGLCLDCQQPGPSGAALSGAAAPSPIRPPDVHGHELRDVRDVRDLRDLRDLAGAA